MPTSPTAQAKFQEIDLTDDSARVDFGHATLTLSRATHLAELHQHGAQGDPELVAHPLLAALGLIAANWRGDVALHAGVVGSRAGDRAWIVLAERGDGKSTTLAAAARAGLPVLSDDLAVIDSERRVWAGPRCIDLRPEAAPQFPHAKELASGGGRPRWRLPIATPPQQLVPVAGFLRLAWSEDDEAPVAVHPADAAHRIPMIAAASALDRPLWSPKRLLDLADLPVHVLVRPKRLDALDAVVAAIDELPG